MCHSSQRSRCSGDAEIALKILLCSYMHSIVEGLLVTKTSRTGVVKLEVPKTSRAAANTVSVERSLPLLCASLAEPPPCCCLLLCCCAGGGATADHSREHSRSSSEHRECASNDPTSTPAAAAGTEQGRGPHASCLMFHVASVSVVWVVSSCSAPPLDSSFIDHCQAVSKQSYFSLLIIANKEP